MIGPVNIYRHGAGYWLRFRDPKGTERRLRGGKSKRVADGVSRHLTALLDFAAAGQSPPEAEVLWVMGLDTKRLAKLEQWGIIQKRHTAAWLSLESQVDAWRDWMLQRGVGEEHAATQHRRVRLIAEQCGVERFCDIQPEKVIATVDGWRQAGKLPPFRCDPVKSRWRRNTRVAESTLAAYLKAFKAFTRWMMNTGQASRDPMAVVSVSIRKTPDGVERSNMAKRRALTEPEQMALIEATTAEPVRYNMAGPERALLYRLALGCGIRKSAVYRLTVADVTRDGYLMARGSGASNKRTTPKPLTPALLADLLIYCRDQAPEDPLFALPHKTGMARMLRKDCTAAGIDVEGVDFHCLRHTFATTLARRGVAVKTLADLLDDSVKVAMGFYTHSFAEDLTQAVGLLPELNPAHGRATNSATA